MTPSQFLEALYRNATGFAELRLIHHTGDWSQVRRIFRRCDTIHTGNFEALAEANEEYHIYHRVNISSTQDSKKHNISQIVALYIDVDDASDEALDHFKTLHYEPTAIVFSGGGFHAYWILREPLTVTSDEARDEVERVMQGLILAYGDGADDKAKDVTRILRTPGFYNIKDKYDSPPLCEVVYFDDDSFGRYSFRELHKIYAPLGTPKQPEPRRTIPQDAYQTDIPRWVQEYIERGAVRGERNNRLYAAARAFLDAGKTQLEAEQVLLSRALADGLPQSEARLAINSAFRAVPNPQINTTMSARYAIGDMAGGAK